MDEAATTMPIGWAIFALGIPGLVLAVSVFAAWRAKRTGRRAARQLEATNILHTKTRP
jgi:hypothetical protein